MLQSRPASAPAVTSSAQGLNQELQGEPDEPDSRQGGQCELSALGAKHAAADVEIGCAYHAQLTVRLSVLRSMV